MPPPPAWREFLRRNAPCTWNLSDDELQRLFAHMHVFLAEKRFEGCGGLELTEEIRVTIAGLACMLLLNRPGDYFPTLRTILVYPSAYVATHPDPQDDGTVIEGPQPMLGESWEEGQVVLAWDEILEDARQPDDGQSVVLHEFAHQLDAEAGGVNGAPNLEDDARYAAWKRVLSSEYERLRDDVQRRRETFLDPYGAQEPAEFFAVVTEAFFMLPRELREEHPQLYEQFRQFFQQDPATRASG